MKMPEESSLHWVGQGPLDDAIERAILKKMALQVDADLMAEYTSANTWKTGVVDGTIRYLRDEGPD